MQLPLFLGPGEKTESRGLMWTDTEPGNVQLLDMKTLSETLLESKDNALEETKDKSVDEHDKDQLTAGTFGFEGEVVKIEKTITVSVFKFNGM